jgi:hypothetical protein
MRVGEHLVNRAFVDELPAPCRRCKLEAFVTFSTAFSSWAMLSAELACASGEIHAVAEILNAGACLK